MSWFLSTTVHTACAFTFFVYLCTLISYLLCNATGKLQAYIMDAVEDLKMFELNNVTTSGDVKVIGKGAYGRVLEVTSQCAAKELHKNLVEWSSPVELQMLKQNFLKECMQCSKLFHPNIVQFLGIYYPSDSTTIPWLVMEKMHTSLTKYLEATNTNDICLQKKLLILHNVTQGLSYLHSLDIIHRDLSSNNILLTRNLFAKIGDLGVAKMVDSNLIKTHTQTPGTVIFMPPEALESFSHYGKPVDIFSFGCVSIHLMTHEWPEPKRETYFDESTGKKVARLETERREDYITKIQDVLQLKKLILHCLHDIPNCRPDIDEVCTVIRGLSPELKEDLTQAVLSKNKLSIAQLQVCTCMYLYMCSCM